jgi:hypothetical protein
MLPGYPSGAGLSPATGALLDQADAPLQLLITGSL